MATTRDVKVQLSASVGDFVAGMGTAAAAVKGLTKEIDTSNDRTAWLAQGLLAIGPALVPIGAAATPIIAGADDPARTGGRCRGRHRARLPGRR